MTPTHQYYAWLKVQHPEFWQELFDCAKFHVDDPANHDRYSEQECGRVVNYTEYRIHPADIVFKTYERSMIIDEAHSVFTDDFIQAIDLDRIASWIAKEAEEGRLYNSEIETCIKFYQGMRRAA